MCVWSLSVSPCLCEVLCVRRVLRELQEEKRWQWAEKDLSPSLPQNQGREKQGEGTTHQNKRRRSTAAPLLCIMCEESGDDILNIPRPCHSHHGSNLYHCVINYFTVLIAIVKSAGNSVIIIAACDKVMDEDDLFLS